MNTSGMVRKHIRAERKARGWNQTDLARAAGIRSKTTIVDLEAGRKLSEGNEGAVERALGWRIGSLDRIRNGGEPELADDDRLAVDLNPRDAFEREVVESSLSRREKLQFIRSHRMAVEDERAVFRRAVERSNDPAASH